MNGSATYNLSNLQTYDPVTRTGINLNVIRHTDSPESIGDVVPLANASDSEAPTDEHVTKTVRLGGTVHGTDDIDLDARIDALKGIFRKRGKNLDISYAGGVRRYVVLKANAIGVDRKNRALYADFSIELICKPYGTDVATTTLANVVDNTSGSHTMSFDIEGTAPYQLPIITITIDALTGTGDYIQVSNDLNGQEIIITGEALAAGDVVRIDPTPGVRSVTINGTEVDYDGTFIELEPGENAITVTDGFTTRTTDILIEYNKRYM